MAKKHIRGKKKVISLNFAHLLVLVFMVVILIVVLNYTGTTQKVVRNVNNLIKNNSSQGNVGKDDEASVKWVLSDDGVLTISGSGAMKDYTASFNVPFNVPWYHDRDKIEQVIIENGVTSIGDSAFFDCSGLTNITIPNSVTSIGSHAFAYCSGLTNITIPNSVTSIGIYAFVDCSGLTNINVDRENKNYSDDNGILFNNDKTSIIKYPEGKKENEYTIPSSVTSIGSDAFAYCSGLTNITIPSSVTSIGDRAFYACSSLTNITIPNSVTSIGWRAFADCSGLTNITISNSVTSVEADAFENCSGLTNINVDRENKNYSDDNGILFNNDKTSIIKYPEGKKENEYTIPSSVTRIGSDAFSNCSGLTNITIPNSVTSIAGRAFADCSGLTNITIPSSVTSIENYAFARCNKLTQIITDKDNTYVTKYATDNNIAYKVKWNIGKDSENSVTAELSDDGVLTISGSGAMKYYSTSSDVPYDSAKIKQVIIENGVTSIGDRAFDSCSGLTNITIPNSVTSIGSYAFDSCSGLTNITIPSSVTSIGIYAFRNCSGLTNITIPSSVTSIGRYAFYNCNKLTQIITDKDNTYVTKYAKDNNISYIVDEALSTNVGYSTTDLTNQDVTVTITANKEITQISGWELSTDKLTLTKTYTANATETVTVKDTKGNTNQVTIKIANIDKIAPTVTVKQELSADKKSNKVTITANEKIQAVSGWDLSSDQLTLTKTYTANTLSTGETVTIKDLAGNTTTQKIIVSDIVVEPALTATVSYSTTSLTNQNVTATIKANKEITSVTGWTLSKDKKTLTKTYTANTTETVTVKDTSGNTKTISIQITNIDKTAPTLKVEKTLSADKKSNKVTITANEEIKTVTGWTLGTDKKTLTKTYTENKTEKVTVTDLAGNTAETTIEITNIVQTEKLTVSVSYSTKAQTNEEVTVTITANKAVKEVTGWTLGADKKTLTKKYTENTTNAENVTITGEDGQTEVVTIEITNIDKIAPKIQKITYNLSEDKKSNTVTIQADKELQNLNGWELSADKKTLTKTYTENKEEEITITDIAGNTVKTTIKITDIEETSETKELKINVEYTQIENGIEARIVANNQLEEVKGWELSEDKLMLKKTYYKTTQETVMVKDIYGNIVQVNIKVIKEEEGNNTNNGNTEDNNNNSQNNANNSYNRKYESDKTLSSIILPKTGFGRTVLGAIVVLVVVMIFLYFKNRSFRDIK